jgi:ABC-type polysaccharide/polyol phosphate transport system ATPase subunit
VVVRLIDVTVEIPLRGVGSGTATNDDRIIQTRRGLVLRALDRVSLEVRRGERVGIRGGNGAGKSTLLKVIGGMLPVASGRVEVNGSTRALLTTGAGTVPALSGRQNARLRYSLLGISAMSVSDYVDNVEDFADLGAFFDLPVGSYSPGMQSRLQFAMNTVEPADILLLDEWMGVADAEFQKKAHDRLMSYISRNEAFLFASHNETLIAGLTDKQATLVRGRLETFHDGQSTARTAPRIQAVG